MRGRAECMTWCCFSRMPRMPNRCGTFSWRSTDLAVAGRRAVRPRPAAAGGRCSGPSNRPALHCFRALQHERRQRGVPVPWRVRVVAQADQRRLRAAETALPFVGDHEPGVAEIHAEMTANGAVSCAVELLHGVAYPGTARICAERSAAVC